MKCFCYFTIFLVNIQNMRKRVNISLLDHLLSLILRILNKSSTDRNTSNFSWPQGTLCENMLWVLVCRWVRYRLRNSSNSFKFWKLSSELRSFLNILLIKLFIDSIKSIVWTLPDIDDTYYDWDSGDLICRMDMFSLSPLETLQFSHNFFILVLKGRIHVNNPIIFTLSTHYDIDIIVVVVVILTTI